MTTKHEVSPTPLLHIIVFVCLFVAGWGVAQWSWFARLDFWYSASPFNDAWWLWWLSLFVVGQWIGRRSARVQRICHWLWWPTLLIAMTGFWQIIGYVLAKFTVGDLHFNHFLGARRAYQGVEIYDQVGLRQSVNASPFVIALLRPFGAMTTRQFLPYWLAANVVCLLIYWFYAWRWIKALWRHGAPGLPAFGLLVCTTVYFNSFQRSVRLGQLDLCLMALIAAGSYYLMRMLWLPGAETSDKKAITSAFVAGLLFGLAIGVKLVPVLLFGPLLLWLAIRWWRRDATDDADAASGSLAWPVLRRRALWLGGGVLAAGVLALGISWAGVGTSGMRQFVHNLPKMSKGSTAGVNFALVARFGKYQQRKLRFKNLPLSDASTRWLWPLRVLVLLLWLWLAWQLKASAVPLLCLFGLACLPLVSPMCWDIYFLWCANFPWLLILVWITQSWPSASDDDTGDQAAQKQARLRMQLEGVLLIGSFHLLGLAGNSIMRNLRTQRLILMELPLYYDEARLLGFFLMMLAFALCLRLPRYREVLP